MTNSLGFDERLRLAGDEFTKFGVVLEGLSAMNKRPLVDSIQSTLFELEKPKEATALSAAEATIRPFIVSGILLGTKPSLKVAGRGAEPHNRVARADLAVGCN